jgi:hypothetical protein
MTAVTAAFQGEAEVDVREFSTLAAAVSDSRTAGKIIVLTGPVSCDILSVPRDRTLRITVGSQISVGRLLDFQGGTPEAGDYRIFQGSGSVVNLGSARVRWFGAHGDGVSEESALVQKAINAVGKGDLLFGLGTYVVANLQLKTGVNLLGEGAGTILKLPDNAHARSINGSLADEKGNFAANVIGTTLNHNGGRWFDNGARAKDENNSSYIVTDVLIRGVIIDGNNARNRLGDIGMNASAMGANISLHQAARITVEQCRLVNARLDGIEVGYTLHGGSDDITIRKCSFENNTRTGIAFITGKHNRILECTIRHTGTGTGIDVEANWDGEVNYRHVIKGNYVEGGIALASARFARMNDILVEGNTVVTGPGRSGVTLSSSRINGGSVIANNRFVGSGGGSAIVILGDIGPTRAYASILIESNEAKDFDYILPSQPNGSMANITMRKNRFTTKYGLRIYRPYNFEFSDNVVELAGGAGEAPLFQVLFGQKSVDPDQGASLIKGNTVRGGGVDKLIDTVIGADAPIITPDFLTLSGNNISVSVAARYPVEICFPVTMEQNKLYGLHNSLHFPVNINGVKITDNEFNSSGKNFPLIHNEASFKHARITGNRLIGIDLGVNRPHHCELSNNTVMNGKGSIIYSFTSGGVGSNTFSGNRFIAESPVDVAFEIVTGAGYAARDFTGEDNLVDNSHSGNYAAPARLGITPKRAARNTF